MQLSNIKLLRTRTINSISTAKHTTYNNSTPSSNKRAAEQNCLTLLESCNSIPKLIQFHTHILKLGLLSNPLVITKFASTSSHLDSIDYASSVAFATDSDTTLYDAFFFNTIIRAYARDEGSKGIGFYKLMLKFGTLPNKFTYPFVLKACASIGDLRLGESIHGSVLKFGFHKDVHAENTMVHMYSCCGGEMGVEFARKLFDKMPKMESVSWSAMIGGYVRLGRCAEAIGLFRKMQIAGVKPDEVTMVLVLSACAQLGALELGKWVESFVLKEGFQNSVELWNALVDMFAKCGDVDSALRWFRNMENKTIVSWTSVIDGMAIHGRGLEAVSLFEEMIDSGIEPDNVSFISLLSACSHSGLVEKGKQHFNLMEKKFGIRPKVEHYGCMVDLLCRAGLIKEAIAFVEEMPFEANSVIWRTLVTACRANGELELGEKFSTKLIEKEPMHDSNYVLLSNIYAKMSRWDKKSMTREVMNSKGMRKIPGSTMIELDNEIHEFVAGDKSHTQSEEIFEMLDEMARKMRRAGYLPSTSDVLLDIGEEDKEDAVNQHSEKLAIAFALLKTAHGTPIRIYKNLRVCVDCHSATKFISKIYNREIVVRDRNRFHHFKDGLCSCRDFW